MHLNFRKTGQGKPLIILHGLFGSADNWLSIAKGLENDFTTYLLDLRNHGDSGHQTEWNYKVMAEDLLEFMEDHQLEKAHLLGHSMGGKICMTFALSHPDLVERLIIVDIAPRYYPVHHQTILEGLNSIDMARISSRREADEALEKHVKERGVRQFLLKSLGRNEQGKFMWKINLPVITEQIENVGAAIEKEGRFEHPTLFMGGENSKYIQDSDKEEIEGIFPNAHIIKIKNAGHWIHAEQPEAVIKTVRAFLD
jgi:pimeloyl-ACP methyl ester carboxylesterase